jgi:hypothetical protein
MCACLQTHTPQARQRLFCGSAGLRTYDSQTKQAAVSNSPTQTAAETRLRSSTYIQRVGLEQRRRVEPAAATCESSCSAV